MLPLDAAGLAPRIKKNLVRLEIRGDKDDPFSRGYICPKAVALQDIHYDKDRLRYPVRRTANGWQRIGWDEAFDEVAQNLKRMGYENAISMDGGWSGWKAAGLPVEQG